MSKLAAFAYRYEIPRIVEPLDKHLYEVAIHTFLQLEKLRLSTAYLGTITGLLHDIGKALDLYQRCVLFDPESKACLYTAHEVFSALMIDSILKPEAMPREIASDLKELLSCSEEEVYTYAKKIVILAILLHHQAMGHPLDRFKSFVSRSMRYIQRIELAESVIDTLKNSMDKISRELGIEANIVIDIHGVESFEETINRYLSEGIHRFYKEIEKRVTSISRLGPGHDERSLLLAKLIAGSLIAADLYVAGKNRGEIAGRPIHVYLEKMFSYLKRFSSI